MPRVITSSCKPYRSSSILLTDRRRWDNLFKHVDIVPNNVHILNGTPEGYSAELPLDEKIKVLEAECTRYEQLIKEAGGARIKCPTRRE